MLKAATSNLAFILLLSLNKEIEKVFSQRKEQKPIIANEEMLQKLPDPVKRYLIYAGVVGKPIVQTVRLKQVGKIRKNDKQPWMNFDAKQYYSVNPPSFVWIAYMKFFGLPLVRVRDFYMEGRGKYSGKSTFFNYNWEFPG